VIPASVALALLLGGAPPTDGELRLAVVAGANEGLDSEQRLEFAEQDARRVHAVLTRLGGVSPGNATLVLGGGPEALMRAVGGMVGQAQAVAQATPVVLLLYVSAHADEEALHLDGQRLPLETVRAALERAPARLRVVVIDGCRVPVRAGYKGGRPGPEVAVAVDRSTRVEGEVVISAAGPGELAQEWSELRGSLFTHALLVGLRGAADFDRNGRVTLNEAYAFAYRTTLARAAESGLVPQRPSFDLRLEGFGDWVFTRVSGAGAEITLAEGLEGRFWITDQRSDVLAEVDKRAGEPLRLALDPGRYRVIRLGREWAEAADVNLALGGSRLVEPGSLVRVRAARALAKGGDALVLRPWSLVLGWSAAGGGAVDALQQAGEVGLAWDLGGWRARVLLGAGWSATPAVRATLRQVELRLPVSLLRIVPVSLAAVGLGVEVRPRLVWQRISRDVDVGSLAGPVPDQEAFLFAAGGLATAALPIGDRFTLGVELWLGEEWGPGAAGTVRARPTLLARTSLAWRL
jgi:hypothetical protein